MKDYIKLISQMKGLSIPDKDYEILTKEITSLQEKRNTVEAIDEHDIALVNVPMGDENT